MLTLESESIRYLRQPTSDDDDDNTWDSTYQTLGDSVPSSVYTSLICEHAVADRNVVYCTLPADCLSSAASSNEYNWFTWKKSLGLHKINAVTSNSDGSVIVASTDEGIVYLLRGSDGELLASRKVTSETGCSPTRLSWIATCIHSRSDSLLIEVPSDDNETDLTLFPQMILVSNIVGASLNHTDPIKVAEAARLMNVQKLKIRYDQELRSVAGFSMDTNTIRLLSCNVQERLTVLDYNTQTKETSVVRNDIFLGSEQDDWTIDYDIEFKSQTVREQCLFIVSAYASNSTASVFWFNPVTLQCQCTFKIPDSTSVSATTKIVATETILSSSPRNIISAAIATKTQLRECTGHIYIVQILVDEEVNHLSDPIVLFTIPLNEPFLGLSLAPCMDFMYSLRFQVSHDFNRNTYVEFYPDEALSVVISKVRTLVQTHDFDTADGMVASTGIDALVSDKYAHFHPSEITFSRLRYSFNDASNVSFSLAQDCLRRLSIGAVSGNPTAFRYLVEAVNYILVLPTTNNPKEYIEGLQGTMECIEKVISTSGRNSDDDRILSKKCNAIAQRVKTLNYLCSLSDFESTCQMIETPFHRIESITHLFEIFVKRCAFSLADDLMKSIHRSEISSESLVEPFLSLSCDVAPSVYMQTLKSSIMPNLTINSMPLKRLMIWSCRLADTLDDVGEDSNNLDEAISLLETIDIGKKNLQIRIHSSFAWFTPLQNKIVLDQTKRDRIDNISVDISVMTDRTSLTKSSLNTSDRTKRQAERSRSEEIPSLLQLSALKVGASKAVSETFVYEKETASNDKEEDLVQRKLMQARSLRSARSIGMKKNVVKLSTFDSSGGIQFVAKALVHHFSTISSNDENALTHFKDLGTFCQSFAASIDRAIFDYLGDLCKGENVTDEAICKAASLIGLCSSAHIRCQGALLIFRAALLCGYADIELSRLSKEAISWASCDSSLQSELEEASRLLLIDSIVLKYCGIGARELFRVDNPNHAISLLSYVTKHVNRDSVIADAMSLCEAFHHLSPQSAASSILQEAIICEQDEICVELFKRLLHQDINLAEKSFIDLIAFVDEILNECFHGLKTAFSFKNIQRCQELASKVCSRMRNVISIAQEQLMSINAADGIEIDDMSLEKLGGYFSIIERLQRHNSIFVSLSQLLNSRKQLEHVVHLVEEIADLRSSCDINVLHTKIALAKGVCRLLSVGSRTNSDDLWIIAATNVAKSMSINDSCEEVLDFLHDLGILSDCDSSLSTRSILAISHALYDIDVCSNEQCTRTMQRVVLARSLVKNRAYFTARGKYLDVCVSLGAQLDIAYEVFCRSDDGIGESIENYSQSLQEKAWTSQLVKNPCQLHQTFNIPVGRPVLHPIWYVGDGLLLPPDTACLLGIEYLHDLFDTEWKLDDRVTDLHLLADGRGAKSLSLRIICHSIAMKTCYLKPDSDDSLLHDLESYRDTVVKTLAERSLGGIGSGITSAIIDSQLSLALLLHLPLKVAFTDFRLCIPVAIKSHNFVRLLTLANIGVVASTAGDQRRGFSALQCGWKNQHKFSEQCISLALKAKWWGILKMNNVHFDSQLFDCNALTNGNDHDCFDTELSYRCSLIATLIHNSSQSFMPSDVLRFCEMYADAFGLRSESVHYFYVRWILAPPAPTSKKTHGSLGSKVSSDIRTDLHKCQRLAHYSLQMITQLDERLALLRKCLGVLDKSESSATDYERYNTILNLYQTVLVTAMDQNIDTTDLTRSSLALELEAVDRRRDVLDILLSIFNGHCHLQRPTFSKFFLPLHDNRKTSVSLCDILGSVSTTKSFDPLQALDLVFDGSIDSSIVAALAPMCNALGIPSGYIHVRYLMARFKKSRSMGSDLPSFDNDVVPTFSRIKAATDKAKLAEWCSLQYENSHESKLKCLDLALQSTIQVSNECEHRLTFIPGDPKLKELADDSLETVKLIAGLKSVYSDRAQIQIIFHDLLETRSISVQNIIKLLLADLEKLTQNTSETLPDKLIDFLLDRGSDLVAEECLNPSNAMSIDQVRVFGSLVQKACDIICQNYSHVSCNRHAKQLTQQWLFHGDGKSKSNVNTVRSTNQINMNARNDTLFTNNQDSTEFVMDLNYLETHDSPNPILSGEEKASSPFDFTIGGEEESIMFKKMTARETSEIEHQRIGLRIAFVLAFATELHQDTEDKENKVSSTNVKISTGRKHLRHLTKGDKKPVDQRDNHVLTLCKDLLQIVFASKGFPDTFKSSISTINDNSFLTSITFSMRHRALRAALILCPQEAFTKVVRESGFLANQGGISSGALESLTFGVYVAKEVEEMGLPLPHSDMLQICTMNFPSYARSLWRHHRDDDKLLSKGRLFLLMLEMSLRIDSFDLSFVTGIIEDMIQDKLFRTLFLALEHIVFSNACEGASTAFQHQLSRAISIASSAMISDIARAVRTGIELGEKIDENTHMHMLDRLQNICTQLGRNEERSDEYLSLVNDLQNTLRHTDTSDLTEALDVIVSRNIFLDQT